MEFTSAIFVTGLLTIGPSSAILDLPYPEVTAPVATPTAEQQVVDTLAHYARGMAERNRARLAETLHPDFTRVTIRRNGVRPDAVEIATARTLADSPFNPRSKGVHQVSEVKVAGGKASATLTLADRTEFVHLVLWNNEWRVLQSLAEPR
jgi:hypothetical protein